MISINFTYTCVGEARSPGAVSPLPLPQGGDHLRVLWEGEAQPDGHGVSQGKLAQEEELRWLGVVSGGRTIFKSGVQTLWSNWRDMQENSCGDCERFELYSWWGDCPPGHQASEHHAGGQESGSQTEDNWLWSCKEVDWGAGQDWICWNSWVHGARGCSLSIWTKLWRPGQPRHGHVQSGGGGLYVGFWGKGAFLGC